MRAVRRALARRSAFSPPRRSAFPPPPPPAPRPSRSAHSAPHQNHHHHHLTPGLFGLEGLHAPDDFPRLARRAAERSESIAGALRSGLASGAGVVDDLDEISDTVCRVVDVAEVCRNVHPDAQWRAAADAAYVQLQGYVQSLNADKRLYDALVRTQECPRENAAMSPEARRVALTLRHDFERGGIHLGADDADALKRHAAEIVHLGMRFQSNLADPAALGRVAIPRRALEGTPLRYSLLADSNSNARPNDSGSASVPLDQRTLGSVLRWCEDAGARETVHAAASRTPASNGAIMAELIDRRAKTAKLLGFESHAHFATAPLLAKTPGGARRVLTELNRAAYEGAVSEAERLAETARGAYGKDPRSVSSSSRSSSSITSADRPYLMALRRQSDLLAEGFSSDASGGERRLADYFPLEGVLRGASLIVERTFGVTLRDAPFLSGEAWCSDARKLEAVDAATGETLGTVYLDLAQRARKFPHAAHFVVRCGRERGRSNEKQTTRQTPAVALVCSFGGGAHSLAKPSLAPLSHAEVETFFHELGHAMHSVLSRTRYQHLSGTRCAADLVEVPSHVFEYFAWDPACLRAIAKHRVTGEAMPDALIDALRRSKGRFAGTETRQQVAFAALDLAAHELEGDVDERALREVARRTYRTHGPIGSTEAEAELHRWELRFGHLVGYGSTYYSYAFARCVAASVWRRYFEGDPLAGGAGTTLREGMLTHGGAKAPEELLRGMLGEEAVREGAGGGMSPDPSDAKAELLRASRAR